MRRVMLEKGLPYVAEYVSVGGLGEGSLSLTNEALLFTAKSGRVIGCDLDAIRSISIPGRKDLAVTYSVNGEMKTLKFEFAGGVPNVRERGSGEGRYYLCDYFFDVHSRAERFTRVLHTLVPDVPIVGYDTISDEKWRKMMADAKAALADYTGTFDPDDDYLNEKYGVDPGISYEIEKPIVEVNRFIYGYPPGVPSYIVPLVMTTLQQEKDLWRYWLEVMKKSLAFLESLGDVPEEVQRHHTGCTKNWLKDSIEYAEHGLSNFDEYGELTV